MNIIQFGNKQINYTIIRGNRKKTISIHVRLNSVTVRAPKRISEKNIRLLMEKKARWIFKRQELIREHKLLYPPREFVSGESFPYLGRQYRLKVMRSENGVPPTCHLVNGRLRVEIGNNIEGDKAKMAVRNALSVWYKTQAENKIRERLPLLAEKAGRRPTSIIIKNQKSRWGSCSHTGIVRFNWKIIMAPVSVLDYLITHELCHLFHQDHSPAYWRKVLAILPEYKQNRKRLKEYDSIMRDFG
jgi:hypothetical protein